MDCFKFKLAVKNKWPLSPISTFTKIFYKTLQKELTSFLNKPKILSAENFALFGINQYKMQSWPIENSKEIGATE